MVIYGEYLFIENFITTFLLLVLTGRLTGDVSKIGKLIIGSLIGAIGSFMIFLPFNIVTSIFLRIMLGLGCVFFGLGRLRIVAKTALFFVLTFTSGGMVMALLLWMQESAINHQGIVYMESITYFKLISIGTLAFGFTYWFVKLVRQKSECSNVVGEAIVVLNGTKHSFRAYVDSGNYLREPISGKPVALIDRKGAEKLCLFTDENPEMDCRRRLIPYRAVGVECGIMEGIRMDKITYRNNTVEDVYLAFYEGEFEQYEVLLNKDFLEGGLLENFNCN